jgi:sterol desaturase/sphingolipid hydroxylase (fatty acid hydroxylase superfamily)
MSELLAAHPYLRQLLLSALAGAGVYVVCAIVILAAELRQRSDMSVYRTRAALHDVGYAIFYQCSIYNVLVSPLFAAILPRLAFLKLGVMSRFHGIVAIVACWLIFDFLNYWMHRVEHALEPLWAFHSVHHAPPQLTLLSSNRIHPFEQFYVALSMMVPALVLGVPQPRWLPLLFLQLFSETMQHSRLTWSFGPLRRLFVSPRFHSIHHSADAREYNGNYGRILSIWDALFGTYVESEQTVRVHGVEGMEVPETLLAQFLHPMRYLVALWMPRQPVADAPSSTAS